MTFSKEYKIGCENAYDLISNGDIVNKGSIIFDDGLEQIIFHFADCTFNIKQEGKCAEVSVYGYNFAKCDSVFNEIKRGIVFA